MKWVSSWSFPPEFLKLEVDEVHVWWAFLDVPASQIQDLEHTLSADERDKSRRFRFPKDCRRYIVARGLLRTILGRYLNVHPSQISFRYGRYGKPAIHKGFGEVCPHFNLSHSQEIALYAFSLNREVGIDLEYMRGDLEVAQLAEHFFLPSEVSTVSALPVHLQQEALYKCWTCKEAYLKARGEGLSLDLNLFEISLIPGKPATLLSTGGNYKETSRWTLVELPLIDNHASALAVEGDDFQIKCWQMTR